MFDVILTLILMLTIGVVLAIIFIIIGVFTKKYWLQVAGKLCFYVPFLIVAIFGEFYAIGSLYYPLFFEDYSVFPGGVWGVMIIFALGFFFILYEISTLFESKKVRDEKMIEHLKMCVKSQESKLEKDKKELESLIENQKRNIEKDKAEIEKLEKNLS